MPFQFEKFTEINSSFAASVTVRQRTGQLGFSTGAVNRFKIRESRYAVLYFDKSQRAVGIGLTSIHADGAIEIKQRESNTYIVAKNFLDKYGIDYEESHRHKLHEDEQSKLLYFLLDDRSDEGDEEEIEQEVGQGNEQINEQGGGLSSTTLPQ